jgi:tRNA nucleotidyltransferase (CCA-adding enzyme)
MDSLFVRAVPILEEIEGAGFEAFFVGGSVRDQILGRAIHDVDIATSATPQEIKSIFPRTVDVGIEHGTVLVIAKQDTYEITTFRTESTYSDFRRPDSVQFVRSLTEDLMRRDFTMNSIAMNKNGEIVDPFNGKEAIEQKQIVTVGNPHERFHEDALRMMRALRFVSQLGFEIEEGTFDSLRENGKLLRHISIERILVEMEKMLAGRYRVNALQLLLESELYQFLPSLFNDKATLEKLITLPIMELSVIEIWSLLCMLRKEDDVSRLLEVWRLPRKTMKSIQRTVLFANKEPFFANQVFELFQAGLEEGIQAAKIRAAMNGEHVSEVGVSVRERYRNLAIKNQSELVVNGTDLLEWRKETPGPWLREYLERIVLAVLNLEVENDKEKIKEWLIQCNLM